ncbi:HAD family hydrolase [Eubacterium uniforme]|uniref:HAD family hydrolase n=1 Tax=Eubacterium uniforme TaxID=39495 RepID=UPI00190EA771|nr:HAD hydrolase family protein [Eubacterium uniforme]
MNLNNDIEMLKICGYGIALANAVPEVLDIADGVTLSNDKDGVAVWLKEQCLSLINEI